MTCPCKGRDSTASGFKSITLHGRSSHCQHHLPKALHQQLSLGPVLGAALNPESTENSA